MSTPAPLPVDLYLPKPALSFGFITIDPLRLALGFDLAEVLATFRRKPPEDVQGPDGKVYTLHALALPHGSTASRRVELLAGELGFGAEDGLLVLIVPNRLAWDVRRMFGERVHGARAHDADSMALLVDPSGEAIPLPIPGVGAIVLAFPGGPNLTR